MPRNKKFEGDMTAIGKTRKPPFCRLPDIHKLFDARHQRFERLAPTSPVASYIKFLSAVTKAQHETGLTFQERIKEPQTSEIERSLQFKMPVIDRNALIGTPVFHEVAEDFFARFKDVSLPEASRTALDRVIQNRDLRLTAAQNLVRQHIIAEELGEHIFVMGALQVLFSIAASKLGDVHLKPLEDNLCPSCGGNHSASAVVGWSESDGTRFCSCLYCGSMWNYVRIKCTFCASTGGIKYREIEGGPGTIQAETCEKCGTYCKIVNHQKDASLDVFADDIGSIALDLLIKDDGTFTRGSFNPFLIGY